MANGATATFQETFQAGLPGLSGTRVGVDAKETGSFLSGSFRSKRELLEEKTGSGKRNLMLARGSGMIVSALDKIQNTLSILVE